MNERWEGINNRLAIIFVGILLVFFLIFAGGLLKFEKMEKEAREAGATFDSVEIPDNLQLIRIQFGSVYSEFFREPFESVVFIFKDGTFMAFTTQHVGFIMAPISWVVEKIEGSGHKVSDVLICIHNHLYPIGFSPADKNAYNYLISCGLRPGAFGIYYPFSKRFRSIDE